MNYAIATAGFSKASGSRSRPEGMAHAVWPGQEATACGLPVVSSLFCYDDPFAATELLRCPLCVEHSLAPPTLPSRADMPA
jgi:hypothetical protein